MAKVMPEIILSQHWEQRGTLRHARNLLGKYLVRTGINGCGPRMITEVEAYDGERDLACHAAHGRSVRTEVMYGPGGHWYVYLCYGLHEMLNLVVGPPGWPAAVLVRGVAGISGPGRLTRRFAITRGLNGRPAEPATGLHIEDHGVRVPPRLVRASPRVGVAYAGPEWAERPWRFTFDPAALPPPPGAPSAQ
jgi:DNA-3-methyladenine glycosylase